MRMKQEKDKEKECHRWNQQKETEEEEEEKEEEEEEEEEKEDKEEEDKDCHSLSSPPLRTFCGENCSLNFIINEEELKCQKVEMSYLNKTTLF